VSREERVSALRWSASAEFEFALQRLAENSESSVIL
jgi:hypothetical protein